MTTGLAPAGGWTVPVSSMATIATPAANRTCNTPSPRNDGNGQAGRCRYEVTANRIAWLAQGNISHRKYQDA